MRALVTIAFISAVAALQGQTLTATDFIAFTDCAATDCYSDLIIAHGYTPVFTNLGSNGSAIHAEPGGSNCMENTAGYITKGITYNTLDAARYTDLYEQFSKMGFAGMLKAGKEGNTVSRNSKYAGVVLSVITYKTSDKCGMPRTGYNITVEKKN